MKGIYRIIGGLKGIYGGFKREFIGDVWGIYRQFIGDVQGIFRRIIREL